MAFKRLNAMPYANAYIEYEKGVYRLYSYKTLVVIWDSVSKYACCRDLYSNTTRKHISAFAKEIGTNYYVLKSVEGTDDCISTRNGDIIKTIDFWKIVESRYIVKNAQNVL